MNTKNGDLGAETEEAAESLRSAKNAAASAVRAKAHRAQQWARSQLEGLQQRVEAQPYKASAWALGLGFLAGIALMGAIQASRRR